MICEFQKTATGRLTKNRYPTFSRSWVSELISAIATNHCAIENALL